MPTGSLKPGKRNTAPAPPHLETYMYTCTSSYVNIFVCVSVCLYQLAYLSVGKFRRNHLKGKGIKQPALGGRDLMHCVFSRVQQIYDDAFFDGDLLKAVNASCIRYTGF